MKNVLKSAVCRYAIGATVALGLVSTVTVAVPSAGAATNTSVGLLLTGPTNDKGYYEDTNAGLMQAAKALHIKTHVISNAGFSESTLVSDAADLAKSGNGLVIGDGSTGAALQAVAHKYPKTQFIVFTAPDPKNSIPNLHAYLTEQGVTSYMLGVLAAKTTKSNHVGFIGGYQDSPSGEAGAGFKAGVQSVNPAIAVSNVIVGSYSDPVGAKSAASSEIANGADVLYGYVDAGLVGVVQAVSASGKDIKVLSATGTTADSQRRCELGSSVVAQAYQNVPLVFHDMITAYLSKKLPKGTLYYGVGNSAIQKVSFCNPAQYTAINTQLSALAQQIASGQVQLSSAITGK
jgi:basic membrane protein A